MRTELAGLAANAASADELKARKSSLEGEYGRALATTDGLAGILGNLALYGIDLNEIKVYTAKVEAVSAAEVQAFAGAGLRSRPRQRHRRRRRQDLLPTP